MAVPAIASRASTGIDDGAFDGSVSLTSDGNARFAGKFTLTPAGDAGQRLTVTGEGDLAELVPPAFADFLSGAIRVAVDADWQQDPGQRLPRITIREGRLATGNVRAEASGTFGGAATDLTLQDGGRQARRRRLRPAPRRRRDARLRQHRPVRPRRAERRRDPPRSHRPGGGAVGQRHRVAGDRVLACRRGRGRRPARRPDAALRLPRRGRRRSRSPAGRFRAGLRRRSSCRRRGPSTSTR